MGALKDWVNQDWVRIGTDGSIKASAALLKIRKTLIDVCPVVKLKALVKKNGQKQLKRKNRLARKAKLWSPTLKKPKFVT